MGKVLFNRYEVLCKLGEGAQSVVYSVSDRQNQGALKAAKILKKEFARKSSPQHMIKEFHILESVDHPNLIRVFDCQFDGEDRLPVFITECIEAAEGLEILLNDSHQLSFSHKIQILFQMLEAIRFLHSKKIIHGDLKPSNILLVPAKITSGYLVKLIDFGVSQDLLSEVEKKRAGTPYYIAPEVLESGLISASDLYSLGVILYRLFFSSALPYQGRNIQDIFSCHLQKRSLFEERDFIKEGVPAEIAHLIRDLLAFDPLDRPRDLELVQKSLQFQYSAELSNFRLEFFDTRSRPWIGDPTEIAKISDGLREGGRGVNLLCIGAFSGGGKTRMLHELRQIAQKNNLSVLMANYEASQGWDNIIRQLILKFGHTKTCQKFERQIIEVLKKDDLTSRTVLFSRLIKNLAVENEGLVLLLDGLSSIPSTSFLKILRTLVWEKTNNKYYRVPLFMFFSVSLASDDENGESTIGDSRKIQDLIAELNEEMIREEKRPGPSLEERSDPKFFPYWVQELLLREVAEAHCLKPWSEKDLNGYLFHTFPKMTFPQSFLGNLLRKTKGNPGVIQSISEEVGAKIEAEKKSQAGLDAVFLQNIRGNVVSDLHVYKIRLYTESERAVLVLMAGFKDFEVDDFCFLENPGLMKGVFIKTFDDGIIISTGIREQFLFQNENVRTSLKRMFFEDLRLNGIVLALLAKAKEVVKPRLLLKIFTFLEIAKEQTRFFLDIYEKRRFDPDRLSLLPDLQSLYTAMEGFGGNFNIDLQIKVQLDLAFIDFCILQQNFTEAVKKAQHLFLILENVKEGTKSAAYGLAHLYFGVSQRVMGRYVVAQDSFRTASENENLCDNDRVYAKVLYLLMKVRETPSDLMVRAQFDSARKELRKLDVGRYAASMASLGNIFLESGEKERGLSFYLFATKIFEKNEDFHRLIYAYQLIAKQYFLLGKFDACLVMMEKSLVVTESQGLDQETMQNVLMILRCSYHLEDWKRFVSYSFMLNSLAEKTKNPLPMFEILEPSVYAYLQRGFVEKARNLITAQKNSLALLGQKGGHKQRALCKLVSASLFLTTMDLHGVDACLKSASADFELLKMTNADAEKGLFVINLYQAQKLYIEGAYERALDLLANHKTNSEIPNTIKNEMILLEKSIHLKLDGGLVPVTEDQVFEEGSFAMRLAWQGLTARVHAIEGNLVKATSAIKKGLSLLHLVIGPISRAQFFDQHARLLWTQGMRNEALKKWQAAEAEFQKFTRTWNAADRQRFFDLSPDVKEHRNLLQMFG